jgi:hypothetical protein
MDKLKLIKIIKYVIGAVAEKDHYKLLALQDHLDSLRVSEEEQGNLYVAQEVVKHSFKEVANAY